MKRRDFLLSTAALGLAGCGSSDTAISPASAQIAQPGTSRLFVLDAAGGTAAGNVLTLTGVAPDVLWFDDRPSRQAGRQSTGSFVNDWAANGFVSVPPNGALDTGGTSFPLELSQPVLEGSTLRFLIRQLSAEQLPATFSPAALFIDDADGPAPTGTDTYQLLVINASRIPQFQFGYISLELGPLGQVQFSSGPPYTQQTQLSLGVETPIIQTELAIIQVELAPNGLLVGTNARTNPQQSASIRLQLYLQGAPGLTQFKLTDHSTPGIEVTAAVGENGTPQPVGRTATVFNWPS